MAGGNPTFDDILVAVHGIGEQARFATVRSVATRLATSRSLVGETPAFAPHPLGHFHTDVYPAAGAVPLEVDPSLHAALHGIGFSEVYWADIPKRIVESKDTLDETKAWARTVVARARATHDRAAAQAPPSWTPPDFGMVGEVLEEMVETIYVLDRLFLVTRTAGVFDFDLKKVLEDYLGDVQIVTEFESHRNDIVGRFHRAMEQIHATNPDADLHVIAHSEGTVVALLGLLHACRNERKVPLGDTGKDPYESEPGRACEWLSKVRGFMTFGSPIDKHVLLWPHLFRDLAVAARLEPRIPWRNYYDLADPVGFELDTAREWLEVNAPDVFEFRAEHDIGYSRYLLAGKAHTDYWNDADVFEHFLLDVVRRPKGGAPGAAVPPQTWPGVRFWSPKLPYLVAFAVLFLGMFVLYRAATAFLTPPYELAERAAHYELLRALPPEPLSGLVVLRNAFCLTVLLAGITLFARIPRLARDRGPRLWGVAALAVGCLAYLGVTSGERWAIGTFYAFLDGLGRRPFLWTEVTGRDVGILVGAWGMALFGLLALWRKGKDEPGRSRPRDQRWFLRGMRPLLACAAVLIAGLIVAQALVPNPLLESAPEDARRVLEEKAPAWPLVLAGIAFLYLWWLAALVFGLAFTWNRYVRKPVAMDRLRAWWRQDPEGGKRNLPAGGEAAAGAAS